MVARAGTASELFEMIAISCRNSLIAMNCRNCAQRILGLFANIESSSALRPSAFKLSVQSRFLSTAPGRRIPNHAGQHGTRTVVTEEDGEVIYTRTERPAWQAQKATVREKLKGEAWNPRKKLSPDTIEGIRHLNQTQPDKFTTPVLSEHFKVSAEAIRRILKSKWRASDEELESRMQRWDKRGERIWSNLVEMGVKPPKRWRDMGVGRAQNGDKPRWKSRHRNLVDVRDSFTEQGSSFVSNDNIIPIVDGKVKSKQIASMSLSERL